MWQLYHGMNALTIPKNAIFEIQKSLSAKNNPVNICQNHCLKENKICHKINIYKKYNDK